MPFVFKSVILVSLSSFSAVDRVSNQHRETRLYLIEIRLGFRKHFEEVENFFFLEQFCGAFFLSC